MKNILFVLFALASSLFAASAPPTVTSISALQLLPPGAYPTVSLLGYNTPGDGGGGILNWVSSSTKAAAACSVYVPSSSPAVGRWERPRASRRSNLQCGGSTLADTLSGPKTYPDLAGVGTRMVVVDANGTASTQSIPAGGSLGNPTATIGLSAVNGSATSGMRSDGAPALSQAIVPTWSGKHTFQDTVAVQLGIRAGNVAASNVTLQRGGPDLWTTPDSIAAAKIRVTDSLAGASLRVSGFSGVGTRMVVADANGNTSTQSIPAATTFANPSASAGLTAVNGSATTAMRSDAAPSISQSIVPTWSGKHTFNDTVAAELGIRAGTVGASNVTLQRGGPDLWTTPDSIAAAKIRVSDSVAGAHLRVTDLAGTGTRMVVVDASGNTSTQTIPTGGSLANPSATIGLSAVNGSATSGMRSDGAPALSQAIVPTWTGKHVFTDSLNISRTIANKPLLSIYSSNNPATNDVTGRIQLGFGQSADYVGMKAQAHQSGAWSSTNKAGMLVFDVLNPGDASPNNIEGMRLTEYGNLLVGYTSDPGTSPIGDYGSIIANGNVEARYSHYTGENTTNTTNGYWIGNYGQQSWGLSGTSVNNADSTIRHLKLKAEGLTFVDVLPTGSFTHANQITIGGKGASKAWEKIVLEADTISGQDINQAEVAVIMNGNAVQNWRSGTVGTFSTIYYPTEFISTATFDTVVSHYATRSLPRSISASGGTLTMDAANASFYTTTLTANTTLAFTNAASGARITLRATEDATGGRTLSYPASCRFPGGTTPSITTTANAVNYLTFIYDESASKWDFVGNAFDVR